VAVGLHGCELFAVEEVGAGTAFAEEEPVSARMAEYLPFVQKTAEGSDAGAGTNHDDRCVGLWGQAKPLVGLNVNWQSFPCWSALGEEGGTDAPAVAVMGAVTYDGDGGVDLACVRAWA
jgi:hypothetical protein